MKYSCFIPTLAILLNCADALPALNPQALGSSNQQWQMNQLSTNNQPQNQFGQSNQYQPASFFTTQRQPLSSSMSDNSIPRQQNSFSGFPSNTMPLGTFNGPLNTFPQSQPNAQYNPANFQGGSRNPASVTATSYYIQTTKSILSNMIANPTKKFNISPILSLPFSNPSQLVKEIGTFTRPQLPSQQQFNFNDLLVAKNFLNQLKEKNGMLSFNELLTTFIDFFSTNNKTYDKVLANVAAIAQQNPASVQSGVNMVTNFKNNMDPANTMKLLNVFTQYQKNYPNEWAKGKGLVSKALNAIPNIIG